ncbi:MAG: hypothetical protein M1819_003643 [Sarea resinae]|nr:MAG: hypothetical protein M1819_003643 [Sarea resinae]
MDPANKSVDVLRQQIAATERDLSALKEELACAEANAARNRGDDAEEDLKTPHEEHERPWRWPLRAEEYQRYGRQLILPEVGLQGQLKLKASSVLIVGVGGLGCPAAMYLAGAGVGRLGLVDGDTVEISNLHRQILHSTPRVGMRKVDSAITGLRALNPTVQYVAHREHLTPQTAVAIVSKYDVILDCTDHPTSRYLISDAAVLLGKPLVSASALKAEGQLMVLNTPPTAPGENHGGPCYRCVFPKPPPPDSVLSCGDGGILGPVVGTMGVLQAIETIKILTCNTPNPSNNPSTNASSPSPPTLLLFSAYTSPQFRSVRLRSRRPTCLACGPHATITAESLTSGSLDYIQFCGVANPAALLSADERISARDFSRTIERAAHDTEANKLVLVDVREKVQFDICHLPDSINIPFSRIQAMQTATQSSSADEPESQQFLAPILGPQLPIYVVCRLGNDSQVVVKVLKAAGLDEGGKRYIGDIRGGLKAWKEEVEPEWPEY